MLLIPLQIGDKLDPWVREKLNGLVQQEKLQLLVHMGMQIHRIRERSGWGWGTESFGVVWSGVRGLASFSSGLIPSP